MRSRFASRTDAGAHARDQVAAFVARTRLDMKTIRNALNYYLPDDVAVRSAQRVTSDFDPRRDAAAREYVYTVDNGPVESPIGRRFEAHVRETLDETVMDAAGDMLEGVRDFAAFARPAQIPGASTVRRMDAVSTCRDGDRVLMTFRANAFLNQQVRRMAAALVAVGRSAMSGEQFEQLLVGAAREPAIGPMPSRGLCLTRIDYPESGPGSLPAESKA